ncbi:MAG: hypothetical protein GXO75_13830 [Calditrichaeota bacterium]|nr:hypothetical protein [Calditrichota bacterium]
MSTKNAYLQMSLFAVVPAVFEYQIGFTDIAGGGDSGSSIVTKNGNDPPALEFAGSDVASFGNPIQAVADYFGVDFCK